MRKISKTLIFTFALIAFSFVNANAQQRITFKKGADSAKITGTLPGNGAKTFVLSAKRGQIMRAEIISRNSVVKFQEGESATDSIWQVDTVSGDNFLYLQNNSSKPVKFTLFVVIK